MVAIAVDVAGADVDENLRLLNAKVIAQFKMIVYEETD